MITILLTVYPDGTRYWYKDGLFHRDNDLFSVVFPDGRKYWYEENRFIKRSNK